VTFHDSKRRIRTPFRTQAGECLPHPSALPPPSFKGDFMTPREEYELLLELIETLKNAHCPIIVEGKRDIAALKKFNIHNVHQLTSSIESEVEKLAKSSKEVVILTDLDKEGRKLYIKLLSAFQRFGVKVNDAPRQLLFKTKLRQIEGLYRRVLNLQKKLRGE